MSWACCSTWPSPSPSTSFHVLDGKLRTLLSEALSKPRRIGQISSPPNMTLADAVTIYRETTVAADALIDELELDSPAVVPWWIKHRHTTLERLLVHMIAESHRHAGHLDILREQLDGFIGLRPTAPNIPDLTPAQWEEQRLRLKELADGD